jgi:hypothetical protein
VVTSRMIIRENAEGLAVIAEEVCAQAIPGAAPYPGSEGGFDMEHLDLENSLWELKEQEVVMIITRLGTVEEPPLIPGPCGTLYEGKHPPRVGQGERQRGRSIEETLRPESVGKR